MCYIKVESFGLATEDGESCIQADPSFSKGYYRKAMSLFSMGKLADALAVFKSVTE